MVGLQADRLPGIFWRLFCAHLYADWMDAETRDHLFLLPRCHGSTAVTRFDVANGGLRLFSGRWRWMSACDSRPRGTESNDWGDWLVLHDCPNVFRVSESGYSRAAVLSTEMVPRAVG